MSKNNKVGACDLTGKEIISPIYESLIYIPSGFEYKNSEGNWIALGWMLDSEGKGIRGTKEEITYNGARYYIVSRDGMYGLTDANGKEIIQLEMDAIEQSGPGFLRIKKGNNYGIMNYQGKTIIPTARCYTSISDYNATKKRFSYIMEGFKGECNNLGRQVSKVKAINQYKNMDVVAFGLKGKVKSCNHEVGTIEFDKNGNLCHIYLEEISRTIHDSRTGRLTQVICKSSKNNDIGIKFEYNASGQVVKIIHKYETFLKNIPTRTDIYEYSYNNNIVTSRKLTEYYNSTPIDPTVYNYSNYKFDSHGNWIYREHPLMVFGKQQTAKDERTIEYYK